MFNGDSTVCPLLSEINCTEGTLGGAGVVGVGVWVAVFVGVDVLVAVFVGVGVWGAVFVGVGVLVAVAVVVAVSVEVGVADGVTAGSHVRTSIRWWTVPIVGGVDWL